MRADNWQRAEQIFHEAIECPPAARTAMIAEACAGDDTLRREVESLLAFHEQSHGLIDSPAFEEGLQAFIQGSKTEIAGLRIGPYKVVREIGRGGMGAVYLAERDDDQYRKRVALKLIKRGMDADFIIQRFRNERQILANLEHPNVARLIDGGTTADGRPYMVMEYVEGQPITEYCDNKQLSIEERLELFRTACSAVQFAHRNLVIHRDLKPGNVLVTSDGVPKLLDFGIAKITDPAFSGGSTQTATVLRVLTPDYASPEQVRGLPITTASDVYSLGVLLYELLTSRRPYRFSSKSAAEIEKAICTIQPDKPSHAVSSRWSVVSRTLKSAKAQGKTQMESDEQLNTDKGQRTNRQSAIGIRQLKGDLDNIVLMALRKEPERRYSSVEQFSEDIRRHLEGLPIIAHEDTAFYRASKLVMRHKIGAGASAVIVLTLIVGLVGIVSEARIARQQALLATQERDRARIQTAKAERVSQFLQDMLGSADRGWSSPNNQKGANPTVAELLDEASQRVEGELADQPEVLASALRTIGNAYQHLGRFDVAEQHLRRSLELTRRARGDDDPEVGFTVNSLAEVVMLKGDYAAAEPLYKQAFTIFHKQGSNRNVPINWLVANLADLGEFEVALKGDPSTAEQFLKEALQVGSGLTGNQRAVLADALANLAQVRQLQGNLDEAERLYRSSVDEYRRLPGAPRWQYSQSLVLLGNLLGVEKKYAEAETVLRQSLDVLSGYSDNHNPNVANTLLSLGRILYREGKYSEAEKDERKSIEIFKQSFPEGHLTFAAPFTVLGLILNKTGRWREAEASLRKGVAIDERLLPKGNWQIAIARGALGECLMTQKRYAEAESLLVESYNDLKASQGEQNPRTDEARGRLTQLYELWHKPDKLAAITSSASTRR